METVILIVEDNDDNILLYEDMFEWGKIPAKLVAVRRGEDAVRRAIETKPVLILMDLCLPGIDGFAATQLLKANPETDHIPVWAVTACVRPDDEDKAREAGCSDYFAKPLSPKILLDRIRAFIEAILPEAATVGSGSPVG
jgi:two-component system cell cycle response regulator DivK